MSNFVPTKRNFRTALLFCFYLKKRAVESQQMLSEAYGDYTPSISTREYWFRRYKKVEDEKVETLLDQNPNQTQEELAESLNIDRSTISKRLKAIGMIQKQGNWVPYELKPRDVERRKITEMLLQRHRRKSFLYCIMTGDEKWERYQQQLMQLSQALKQKRPDYAKRHNKVIFQHDINNARPHVANPIKETLEALNWNVLSHPPYSLDIILSHYHLIRPMSHGLSEQRFHSYEVKWKKMGRFVDSLKR
ncbi:MOS1T transposase, partial [Pseudoatta argentina]